VGTSNEAQLPELDPFLKVCISFQHFRVLSLLVPCAVIVHHQAEIPVVDPAFFNTSPVQLSLADNRFDLICAQRVAQIMKNVSELRYGNETCVVLVKHLESGVQVG